MKYSSTMSDLLKQVDQKSRDLAEGKLNETGHDDVKSAKNQVQIAMSALQKMSGELGKLNDEDSLPTWWTNKVAVSVDKLDGMADYLDTQVESKQVNEESMKCPRCGTMNETPFDKCSNCGLPKAEFSSFKKEEEVEEARQLKDPKKETMVVKNKKVEVIDKKDLKKYLSKGYIQAEETELEEDYYNVIYKDKRGKVEGERAFKDKNQAQRYADGGNKKDKVGGTYNVVKVKGRMEALDKVNPDAVKKKFDDRKDKDIDNDGDVDSTDKYLHKRRKAISKAIAKEEVVKEYNEIGTPEYTKHTLEVTPGQEDADWNKQVNVMHEKANTMREALAKVWGMKEGKNPFKKEEEEKPLKKTMTGEKPTKVEVEPKIKQ
jgi:ribosomal protein L37E